MDNATSQAITLDKLPFEIITKIISNLSASDRKRARLVCYSLNRASGEPTIMKRQKFVHKTIEFDVKMAASLFETLETVKYNHFNLEFRGGCITDLYFPLFLTNHAHKIYSIIFTSCELSFPLIQQIIIDCVNLKELRMVRCDITNCNLDLSKQIVHANLQILDISEDHRICDNLMVWFLNAFPNIRTLIFDMVIMNYDHRIYKRFYPNNDVLPSAKILTFQKFLNTINEKGTQIEKLNLNRPPAISSLSDKQLINLASSPNFKLTELKISFHNGFSINGLQSLLSLQPNITCLDLSEGIKMDSDHFLLIFRQLPNIEYLKMNFHIENETEVNVIETLQQSQLKEFQCKIMITRHEFLKKSTLPCRSHPLNHLSLSTSSSLGKYFVTPMLEIFKNLTFLDMNECQISCGIEEISELIYSQMKLKTLKLKTCSWVVDSLFQRSKKLQHLEWLELSNCTKLTAHCIENFRFPELKGIALNFCDKIEENGFTKLSDCSLILEQIFLNGTKITDQALLQMCSHLKFLYHLEAVTNPPLNSLSLVGGRIEQICSSLRLLKLGNEEWFVYNYIRKELMKSWRKFPSVLYGSHLFGK